MQFTLRVTQRVIAAGNGTGYDRAASDAKDEASKLGARLRINPAPFLRLGGAGADMASAGTLAFLRLSSARASLPIFLPIIRALVGAGLSTLAFLSCAVIRLLTSGRNICRNITSGDNFILGIDNFAVYQL